MARFFVRDFSCTTSGSKLLQMRSPFKKQDEMLCWFREMFGLCAIKLQTKSGYMTWVDRCSLPSEIINNRFLNSLPKDDLLLMKEGVMNPSISLIFESSTVCEGEGFEYLSYMDYYADDGRLNVGRIIHIEDEVLALQFKVTFSDVL
jgi:hypothetical protein